MRWPGETGACYQGIIPKENSKIVFCPKKTKSKIHQRPDKSRKKHKNGYNKKSILLIASVFDRGHGSNAEVEEENWLIDCLIDCLGD